MMGAADRPPTQDSQGQTTSLDVPSFVPITGWLLEKCPSSNQAYGFFQGINIVCGGVMGSPSEGSREEMGVAHLGSRRGRSWVCVQTPFREGPELPPDSES